MGLAVFDDTPVTNANQEANDTENTHTNDDNNISVAHMDIHEKAHNQLLQYKTIVQNFARQVGRPRNRPPRGALAAEGDVTAAVDFITSMVIRAMNEAKYVCSESTSSGSSSSSSGRAKGLIQSREDDEESIEPSSSSSTGPGKEFGHFGLGLHYYTHYTSPIRRYADIIVHR